MYNTYYLCKIIGIYVATEINNGKFMRKCTLNKIVTMCLDVRGFRCVAIKNLVWEKCENGVMFVQFPLSAFFRLEHLN